MSIRKAKTPRNKGFTLIELLVVVIIIGILAAIALPNFIGAQEKARAASVKANMRTAQIAAESFATDNGGTYPPSVNVAYQSYFPGGKSDGINAAANGPVNPFTNIGEWPIAGNVSNVALERSTAPGPLTGATKGQVAYNVVNGDVTVYAIEGADSNANKLPGAAAGTTLVLSNQ